MDCHLYSIIIRVLIYPEGGELAARALELDLLGYGKNEREATEDLKRAIEAQVSFSHQIGDSSLIPFAAEKEYSERWDEAHRRALRSELSGDKSAKMQCRAVFITFTGAELKSLRQRKQFVAPACA